MSKNAVTTAVKRINLNIKGLRAGLFDSIKQDENRNDAMKLRKSSKKQTQLDLFLNPYMLQVDNIYGLMN